MVLTTPSDNWHEWWYGRPHAASLAAGAVAGIAAEALLFPLDCFKTRLQSKAGFEASGGFRGAYRGVGAAMAGSAPASAIFFCTYESTKHSLAFYDRTGPGSLFFGGWVVASVSSMVGELAACFVRVPVDLAKQRLQVGHTRTFWEAVHGVRNTHRSLVLASFRATAMRDISHSSLQFPMYELLKLQLASHNKVRNECLPTYQSAMCGSVAGALSALVTTPLDLVKTRLNLRTQNEFSNTANASALVKEEIRQIYSKSGWKGFFCGASYRAAWMGVGGFVFLGSFELAKDTLTPPRCGRTPTTLLQPPSVVTPAVLNFGAGLIAGLCVDVPLHPVDTIKTRLQGQAGFHVNGGFKGVWNGLSAVLLTQVPASAIYFLVYEQGKYEFDQRTATCQDKGKIYELSRDAIAASFADVCACSVRVPCEVLKQRMQIAANSSFQDTFLAIARSEGFRGFYAGLNAMICREIPFQVVQMPLFEQLKKLHPLADRARKDASLDGIVGATSGMLAGAVGGAVTTPFDTTKTRIILTADPTQRCGVLSTMRTIVWEQGLLGLFRGVVPRTLYCTIGGGLCLGSYNLAGRLLNDANGRVHH